MDRLARDVRFALRGFWRTPTFTATSMLILGLGIGMAVAMVTVFKAVLRRRLPVLERADWSQTLGRRWPPGFRAGTPQVAVLLREAARQQTGLPCGGRSGRAPADDYVRAIVLWLKRP